QEWLLKVIKVFLKRFNQLFRGVNPLSLVILVMTDEKGRTDECMNATGNRCFKRRRLVGLHQWRQRKLHDQQQAIWRQKRKPWNNERARLYKLLNVFGCQRR
ncbi:hypothetical protein, partial [Paenibacillus dendritiformis]|uniref:hypothetical protein n=1 Tax=Paenibacillus dendritiformis TaxID=130049 RepID=UPI000DB12158